MSALRIPGPDGRTILQVIDDGCSPNRSSRGIRGSLGEPVFGMFVVGTSDTTKQRQSAARHRERRRLGIEPESRKRGPYLPRVR